MEFGHFRNDDEALALNVKGCRYAWHFLQAGKPGSGSILTSELDDHTVSLGENEVVPKRPRTMMRGDSKCKFRYALPGRSGSG